MQKVSALEESSTWLLFVYQYLFAFDALLQTRCCQASGFGAIWLKMVLALLYFALQVLCTLCCLVVCASQLFVICAPMVDCAL